MTGNRVLSLEGVHNFRDFGGYPMAGGARLKRGYLWRSGQHHGATDADLERIAALNLASVFDLRSHRERTSHPCRREAQFRAEVHHAPDPGEASAPHVAAARMVLENSAQGTHDAYLRNYAGMPFRPELQQMIGRLIETAASGGGPILVNCMAGKDRTGLAVALVQTAAGLHPDDIMEDYSLTNTAGDVEARIAAGAETIRAMTGSINEASVRVLMSVEPEYLEAAFAAIRERHGSMDSYLGDALQAGPARRAALREALMER